MASITNEAIKTLEKFIGLIKIANIHIERAVLFGSYARGTAGKWSDIDVAVVSSDFSGKRFYDNQMLVPFLLKTDSRIEIHPYKPEDFTEDDLFVKEILKHGVEIDVRNEAMKNE